MDFQQARTRAHFKKLIRFKCCKDIQSIAAVQNPPSVIKSLEFIFLLITYQNQAAALDSLFLGAALTYRTSISCSVATKGRMLVGSATTVAVSLLTFNNVQTFSPTFTYFFLPCAANRLRLGSSATSRRYRHMPRVRLQNSV